MNHACGKLEKILIGCGLLCLLLLLGVRANTAYGRPRRLPPIISEMFSSNMVLQRDMPVPVWGWDKPGQKIKVSFAGQTLTTTAGADGHWIVRLKPMHASSTPRTMTVVGSRVEHLSDVLVGDVWLCSGQSNMAYNLKGWTRGGHSAEEIKRANHPTIRLLLVNRSIAGYPKAKASCAPWRVCRPSVAWNWTAVGYFFARDLTRKLHIPIGIIQSDWGGTTISVWMPKQAFFSTPKLKYYWPLFTNPKTVINSVYSRYIVEVRKWIQAAQAAKAAGQVMPPPPPAARNPITSPNWPTRPACLFNTMIHPLAPYAIKGVVWYQGENDVFPGLPYYRWELTAMIQYWRKLWHRPNLPFDLVQICPCGCYGRPWDREASLVWQPEEDVAATVPHCGIIGTMDIGMLSNIHPFDKKDVGYRLSLLALSKTYGFKGIVYEGPMYKGMTIHGHEAIIHFKDIDGGLKSRNGKPLVWFAIAGANHHFVKADARIVGNTVVVTAASVRHPVAVRYGWNDRIGKSNLENSAGLPAMPFATDVPQP